MCFHLFQVLLLLDAMGLSQYKEHFKNEKVNGEILSECDDGMLSNDLCISSKLHRKRLLKVITGEECYTCFILLSELSYLSTHIKS